MDVALSIIVTFLLTLVNGFFSMSEMALVNVKRPLLERDMEEGDKKAATAFELSGDSGDLLAAIQVAITLVQIVLNNSLVHYGALSPYGKEIPLAAAGIEPVALGLPSPKEVAEAYLHATLMGETDLVAACASSEPLDELDDAFARIEYKLVAQSA